MDLGKYFRFLRKKEPTKVGEVRGLPDIKRLDRAVIGNLYTISGVYPIFDISGDIRTDNLDSFSGEILHMDSASNVGTRESSIRIRNPYSRSSVWIYSNATAYDALRSGETADVKITRRIHPQSERVNPLDDKIMRLEDLHPEGDYNEEDLLRALHISMSESLATSNRLKAMFK